MEEQDRGKVYEREGRNKRGHFATLGRLKNFNY